MSENTEPVKEGKGLIIHGRRAALGPSNGATSHETYTRAGGGPPS